MLLFFCPNWTTLASFRRTISVSTHMRLALLVMNIRFDPVTAAQKLSCHTIQSLDTIGGNLFIRQQLILTIQV
jgi:hypothetical protein